LWMRYREAFADRRISTFRDLTLMGKRYKFFSSFECDTLRTRPPVKAKAQRILKPRA